MQLAHNGYYKGSIPFGLNVLPSGIQGVQALCYARLQAPQDPDPLLGLRGGQCKISDAPTGLRRRSEGGKVNGRWVVAGQQPAPARSTVVCNRVCAKFKIKKIPLRVLQEYNLIGKCRIQSIHSISSNLSVLRLLLCELR